MCVCTVVVSGIKCLRGRSNYWQDYRRGDKIDLVIVAGGCQFPTANDVVTASAALSPETLGTRTATGGRC